MRPPLQLLFLLVLLFPMLLSAYEAPEDREDVFAARACPAVLLFEDAAFLEDMTVELACHCKPERAHSVVWYYQRRLRGAAGARVLTDFEGTVLVDGSRVGRGEEPRRRFSLRLFSLLLFRAQESDSGHYVCGTSAGRFFYGYHIDVQRAVRVSLPPRPPRAPPRPQSGPYRVFTGYWPWSVCDRCGVRGEQTRAGLCYVQSRYLSVRYIQGSSSPSSSSSSSSAPCGSAAVPPRFRLDSAAKGAELVVRSCRVPCPPVPAATAERQTLLELLGLEEPASQVAVRYRAHAAGSPLVLACPGAQPHLAVAWDRAGRPLYRAQHLNASARVYIDPGHHLHLRPVTLGDRAAYTCWLQGRRAAEIHLAVYLRLGRARQLAHPGSQHALRALGLCYAAYGLLFLLLSLLQLGWRRLRT